MKLTKETIKILENFSNINNRILIKKTEEGLDRTILAVTDIVQTFQNSSQNPTVYGYAVVPEIFERNVPVADLKKFLKAYSILEEPELEFTNTQTILTKDNSKTSITHGDASYIHYPSKVINFNEYKFSFDMPKEMMDKFIKFSGTFSLPYLNMVNREGTVFLDLKDIDNPDSDGYSLKLGHSDQDFNIHIKIERLKLIMSGNYKVCLSMNSVALKLESLDNPDLHYIMAVNSNGQ